MSPEDLMSLTAGKGLPLPDFGSKPKEKKAADGVRTISEIAETGSRVDAIAALLRNERRFRDMLRRLERRGDADAIHAFKTLVSSRHFGNTATGKTTHTAKPLRWTHAECAQACKGLEDRYYQAMRYEYALDDTAFFPVSTRLFEWALERREVEEWPATMLDTNNEPKRYLRELVEVWMLEARCPSRFKRSPADPDLRQILTDIHPRLWHRRASKIYEAIRQEYQCWLSIGASHMGRLLREDAA